MIHRVRRVNSAQWQPIWDNLVNATPNTYIASTFRPGSGPSPSGEPDGSINVPNEQWCRVFTINTVGDQSNTRENGYVIADAMAASLGTAGLVVFDEISSKTTEVCMGISLRFQQAYPQLKHRWGLYLVAGAAINWKTFQGNIVETFKGGGILFPEFYIRYDDYCGSGDTVEKKDAWLKNQIVGTDNFGRMKWLVNIREALDSDSKIAPIVSVVDRHYDGPEPYKMLDRVFYVWSNSGYQSFMRWGTPVNPGGMGSWKWDNEDEDFGIGDGGVPNVGRAEQFVKSWDYYALENKTTPRPTVGVPSCKGAGNSIRLKESDPVKSSGTWTRKNYRDKELQLKDKTNMIEQPKGNNGAAYLFRSLTDAKKTKDPLGRFTPQRNLKSYFAIYVNEVVYGFGANGQEVSSKYYTRFYPTSYKQNPIQVSGISIDEKEYGDFSEWIRASQVDIAKQAIAYVNLLIPTTGVNVWGFIDNIEVNVNSQNHGIPVGPTWEFTFIPVLDETDPNFDHTNSKGALESGESYTKVPFFDQDTQWKSKFEDFSDDYLATLAFNSLEIDIPAGIDIIQEATQKLVKKNTTKGRDWDQWFQDHEKTHNPWGWGV